jgi:hypothetical protein
MPRDFRAYVRERLPRLDIRAERETAIVEELAQPLEAAYQAAVARSADAAEARAQVEAEVPDWHELAAALSRIERPVASRLPAGIRAPGGPGVIGTPRGGLTSGLLQDVGHAIRALSRAPGFSAVAITTPALGIGATTIVFSIVDGILLKPLPIADPERVVLAREMSMRGDEVSVSWPNFLDWQQRARSYEGLAAWRGCPPSSRGPSAPAAS